MNPNIENLDYEGLYTIPLEDTNKGEWFYVNDTVFRRTANRELDDDEILCLDVVSGKLIMLTPNTMVQPLQKQNLNLKLQIND